MTEYGTTVKGRQILHLIYHFLRVSPTLANHYNVEDLSDLQWLGDSVGEIDRFLGQWLEIMEGMQHQISDEEKAVLLHKRMKNSEALKSDVGLFREAGHKTPHMGDHTQNNLLHAMQHYVGDHREDLNTASRKAAHKAKMGKWRWRRCPARLYSNSGGQESGQGC